MRLALIIILSIAGFFIAVTVVGDKQIKANAPQMIYHLSKCQSYKSVVIKKEEGDRWFASEEKAVEAGFRKAKNCP